MRSGTGRGAQLVTLMALIAALITVLLLKQRCATAVGGYFEQLGQETSKP